MTPPTGSRCTLESDRLLVLLEAIDALRGAAASRRLPSTIVAAIAEVDRLAGQLGAGAEVIP